MSESPLESPTGSTESNREFTIAAIVLGIVLSIVLGAANVYLGLKVGMTVSASIPAAVIAMALFRVIRRGGNSILESNLVQTAASAGESLAAGIIFTMPALVIANIWPSFAGWERFFVISAIAIGGGLLGILFMIPMRRVFVVENKELQYPEGVACAEVLRAGAEAGRGAALVLGGIVAGAAIKFLAKPFHLIHESVERAIDAGQRVFYVGSDVSGALIGVGFIVKLPIAVLIFLGGALAWIVTLPILGGYTGEAGATPVSYAWDVWGEEIRYMGVGAMIVAGLTSIWTVRHGLKAAFDEVTGRFRTDGGAAAPRHERNIGNKTLVVTGTFTIAAIAALYWYVTGDVLVSAIVLVAMILLSFFITAVASYIVGLVGNSNSPVSGMTITALLITSGLVYLFGYDGGVAVIATLGVAGVVCCVACTSGDVCNDLKTGHMVGASPRNQQILQIVGVAVAAFVMWPVLHVLHESNIAEGGEGIGGKQLGAPQASLFANLTKGFFMTDGESQLPQEMLWTGVAVGIAVYVADLVWKHLRPNTGFRLHLMPMAVGIYLPLTVSTPILLGGIAASIASWMAPMRTADDSDAALAEAREGSRGGVLLASGIIAGESLAGVLWAFVMFFSAPGDGGAAGSSWFSGPYSLLSLLVLIVIPVALILVSRTRTPRA